ncbi:hypothetical protein D0Z00_002731 [Geotrichum galactomycetum]|uniref:Uncharacterized protein n=1 Tax=Geotrichum galactomycetum TaxID=27317 RepID=A0ACB6V3I2_9ASCO|nr:hypothetical protein D0Z00_002731 [Geotrichum candidum]
MYYRNANCAVVVYDITQSRQANENIIIALAGNKLDLAENREVQTEEAAAYAKEAGLLFFETSAKSGENVTELFTAIAQKLPLESAANSRPGRSNAKGIDLKTGSGDSNSQCQC